MDAPSTTRSQDALEALARSEARFRTVFNQAMAGVVQLDADSRIVLANRRWCEMLGYREEELLGMSIADITMPESLAPTLEALRALAAGGSDYVIEKGYRRKDGSALWGSSSVSALRGSDGSYQGVVAVVVDVSEHRRSLALQTGLQGVLEQIAAGERLGDVLAALAAVIEQCAESGPRASILLLDAERRHLRHGAGPSLPAGFNAGIDGLAVGPDVGCCGAAAATGKPAQAADIATDPKWQRHRALALDHGLRACWSTPICSRRDEVLGTLALYWPQPQLPAPADLRIAAIASRTAAVAIEHSAAETALRESEQRFRSMADSAPVMLWVTGADGRCTFLSRSWYAFTGETPATGLGYGWLRGVHPDDRHEADASSRAAYAAHEPFRLEYRLRRQDGEYRWVWDAAVPRFDAAGKFEGYIGSVIDITERKHAEQALQEGDRRKDEFLATLAHELRNPLAPIRNALAILKLGRGGPSAERIYEMMDRQVTHMVRLVDDLLELSRITRGSIELRRERVELAAVLRSAVETSRPLIDRAGHHLSLALPDEPVILDADPVRLAQVFSNLLNNAAKYTPDHGCIWVGAQRRGDEIEVAVRDNGLGLAADMLPRVFEMFTQVTRGRGGLGIGLPLTRSLLQLHGGRIDVHSPGLGQGSEFVVTLPLAPQRRAEAAPQPDAGPDRRLAPKRVLVVDDNRDAADSLGDLLRCSGADACVVYDGHSALQVLPGYRPDVVLLDLGMPGLDGYEVARRIREQPGWRGLPLVALNGWGQEEDRRRSREAGFDQHLVKPAELGTLQALLAGLDAR